MTPSRLLAALLLASALTFSACSSEESTDPSDAEPMSVTTAVAAESAEPTVYRYSGTIQGARRIPLSTKMMGTITSLDVEAGDRVRRGQTLVQVRSQNVRAQKRQVEARLQEARAALKNAKTNFERIESLKAKDSATQKEFDDAETGFERAKARVEALESQLAEINDTLDYSTITSPIDGFVVEKRAEEGALATPGRPLLVVETLDELKAVVQVPEAEINRFKMGESVNVEIGAADDATLSGEVTQINPGGNYASRQFEVQVKLNRDDAGDIKSGMYAEVLYPVEEAPTLTVPADAIVHRGQLTGLFAVHDSTALLRWVRVGEQRGDRIEVLSGLRPGETYIADATGRILDGQTVRTQ
ncbi:efflux transporter periplasmic adaptor subunit [Longibacter salinarum]|uniref:Efflux transporter periplasmic adaptor subunit n=1 Tax=Longibacter salinarum TaxID=1850348 RepID=A0A2A8D193_9BACT|nr:efflux RND transporter periplasmic adaptor subunit [Longibacter salinarum]PEN14661.1 efflux transporter periplasmic adaptor subunit [Longibacter salinarum]